MPTSITLDDVRTIWHSPEPERPNPAAQIVFAVPAKDEEESISACIQAIENQYNAKGKRIPWSEYEALILVNNTTDDTVQRAMAMRRHPGIHVVSVQLPASYAHIGCARRLAMEWGSERLKQGRQPRGIIVSTDATRFGAACKATSPSPYSSHPAANTDPGASRLRPPCRY